MMKRNAFTIVEMLVVLAVIAIISTLTFGVISNTVESNKKASCVANLSQVYGALRLYAQDYDGEMPYYNPDVKAGQPGGGIGLWALTTYPAIDATDLSNPIAVYPNESLGALRTGYLRSRAKLHCPSDRFNEDLTSINYNSYMQQDDITTDRTYETFRASASKRQLRYFVTPASIPIRRISDSTVITWCRYHRALKDSVGTTKPAPGDTVNPNDPKDRDNVLFFDGRVQSLPTTQVVTDTSNATGTCSGWRRVPTQVENSLESAANCQPAN